MMYLIQRRSHLAHSSLNLVTNIKLGCKKAVDFCFNCEHAYSRVSSQRPPIMWLPLGIRKHRNEREFNFLKKDEERALFSQPGSLIFQ